MTPAALRARVARAKPGGDPQAVARARAALLAWLDTQRRPVEAVVRDLASGAAAVAVGRAVLAQVPMPAGLACAAGCAWCCVLPGADGGTITGSEARALHGALDAPSAGGRHPMACPALDPETRTCRAYDARPMICRTYVSPDAAACARVADGQPAVGPATHPAQLAYLTTHAVARAALAGVAPVRTYALRRVAAAADEPVAEALRGARHGAGALDAERRRLARGLRAARA